MKAAGGYARVWRSIYGHPAFRDAVEEAAFIWMIGKAAWQPARVRYKERVIHLQRGQLALSVRDLAAGFRWSKGTTERFLDRLKTESMIGTDVGTGVQIITICNYSDYQALPEGTGTGAGTDVGTGPGQGRDTEQVIEEDKKESPPTPPRGSGRTFLPSDWQAPPISELPPKAQACARQWPREAYEREAEGFGLYWQSERKMKADWRATWANRIITRHWAIMREARAGGAGEKPYHQLVAEGRA